MSFTRYTMIYIDIFHSLTLTGPHPMSIALQYTVSTSRLKVLSFPPVSRRLRCESNTTLEFLVWVVYPRRYIYIYRSMMIDMPIQYICAYIYISKPKNTMCMSHWSHAGNINLCIWMNYHTHILIYHGWVGAFMNLQWGQTGWVYHVALKCVCEFKSAVTRSKNCSRHQSNNAACFSFLIRVS